MSDSNELGVDEKLTRKVRNIAMTSQFDFTEQLDSQSTRRVVVATGVKLAYTVPIVAASLKVSTLGASAAVTGGGLICDDDSSPKQCPPNSGVQFSCKVPGSCPEEIWGDVEVVCNAAGVPECRFKENEPNGGELAPCTPLPCDNLPD